MAQEIGLSSNRKRPVQLRRVTGWSQARQSRFLDALAGTCNVRLSAETAGVGVTTVYARRRTDPHFAARWQEALLLGYERLETALLERALRSVAAVHPGEGDEAVMIAADAAVAEMDFRLIRFVLEYHRGGKAQQAGGRTAARHIASEAETNAALLKRLAVLERKTRGRA